MTSFLDFAGQSLNVDGREYIVAEWRVDYGVAKIYLCQTTLGFGCIHTVLCRDLFQLCQLHALVVLGKLAGDLVSGEVFLTARPLCIPVRKGAWVTINAINPAKS